MDTFTGIGLLFLASLGIQAVELGKVRWHNSIEDEIYFDMHLMGLTSLLLLWFIGEDSSQYTLIPLAFSYIFTVVSRQDFDKRGNWWKWHLYSLLSSWPAEIGVLWDAYPLYIDGISIPNVLLWGLNGLIATYWWAKFGRTSRWRRIYQRMGVSFS